MKLSWSTTRTRHLRGESGICRLWFTRDKAEAGGGYRSHTGKKPGSETFQRVLKSRYIFIHRMFLEYFGDIPAQDTSEKR
jgi:hypothetical protein